MAKSDKKEKKKKNNIFLILGLSTLGLGLVILVGVLVFNAIDSSLVKSVSIESAYQCLYIGDPNLSNVEIDVTVYPEQANDKSVIVYSSNYTVAKPTITLDGKLRIDAISCGSATITLQSASNKKLKDSVFIEVKDEDVKSISFKTESYNTVSMQKDGIEHYVSLNVNPIGANLDKIVVDYDEKILDKAFIDAENKRLVIVPKDSNNPNVKNTKLTQVYLNIYVESNEGIVLVPCATIDVKLLEKEGYLKFNYASFSTESEIVFQSSDLDVVYVDPFGDASSIVNSFLFNASLYYDKTLNDVGEFIINDYQIKVNNQPVVFDNNVYTLTNQDNGSQIKITKNTVNKYYEVVVGNVNGSEVGDDYLITLTHLHTGAQNQFTIKYLKQDESLLPQFKLSSKYDTKTMGSSIYKLNGELNYVLFNNTSCMVETSIDKNIDLGLLKINLVKNDKCSVADDIYTYTNENGDSISLQIKNNRLFVVDVSLNKEKVYAGANSMPIAISINISRNYWNNSFLATMPIGPRSFNFYIDDLDISTYGSNLISENEVTTNGFYVSSALLNIGNVNNYFNTSDITLIKEDGSKVSEETTTIELQMGVNKYIWKIIISDVSQFGTSDVKCFYVCYGTVRLPIFFK